MERFYGAEHAVEVTNDEAALLLRSWLQTAIDDGRSDSLVAWLDARVHRRAHGTRAFRISPAPESLSDGHALDIFAAIVGEDAAALARGSRRFLGLELDRKERQRWLAITLDLLGFVNEARGQRIDHEAPQVSEGDALDVMLRRMWARFTELSRRENYLFPEDPAYPEPALLLEYLDQILTLAERDGREHRRAWPFPMILWEREILLEKLQRFEDLAETMRRSAALEEDHFKRATEDYIASMSI